MAATKGPFEFSGNTKLRRTAMFGRPMIFGHRWPGMWGVLPGPQNDIALYDHAPLAATLERLVDFDLLNRSGIRISVMCVDIETGDEVVFDTERYRAGIAFSAKQILEFA